MPRRRADRIDSNQPDIVKDLRKMGYSVETGYDDILVGANGKTHWIEVKHPDTRSKKTGLIRQSEKKASQIRLEAEFKGSYAIVTSLDEILELIKG